MYGWNQETPVAFHALPNFWWFQCRQHWPWRKICDWYLQSLLHASRLLLGNVGSVFQVVDGNKWDKLNNAWKPSEGHYCVLKEGLCLCENQVASIVGGTCSPKSNSHVHVFSLFFQQLRKRLEIDLLKYKVNLGWLLTQRDCVQVPDQDSELRENLGRIFHIPICDSGSDLFV